VLLIAASGTRGCPAGAGAPADGRGSWVLGEVHTFSGLAGPLPATIEDMRGSGVGRVRPASGEVLHFSEEPHLTVFVPQVAATAHQAEPYVWAVDRARAPDYWFPRDCPRVLTWARPTTTEADRERFLGASARVHAIEYGWLAALETTVLYAYRFAAADFAPFGRPEPHAHVATMTVRPLGPPEQVGSLLAAHAAAGIELRVMSNLWPYWNRVVTSTLGFSGIRLGNARPAPAPR
jgi:hypothetical protein